MKIASLISGLLIVTLLVLFFTGVIDFQNNVIGSIITGNRSYAASNYEQALEAYKKGLGQNSEDPKLNYNSGQASYRLNKYEDAVKYYVKTSDSPDKYLNSGNSSLKLADSTNDATQKQQYYQQALETYKQGIIAFPENIPLKYNYEYVKNKIGDNQNNNDKNKKNNEQNKDNQENQDKNNQNKQNENSEQNEQNKNSQQNEQNNSSEQNSSSQQDKQNGSSGQKENKEQNQENPENQQSSQTDKNNGQNKPQAGEQNEEKKGDQNASKAEGSDSSKSDQTESQIANVLRMLEKQEEDSLKNNQEQKSNSKGDEYDW